jgi:FAD/FMN-containing dehydrogenase
MIDAMTLLSVMLVISSVVMVAITWHHDRTIDKLNHLQDEYAYLETKYWRLYDDHYDPDLRMNDLLYPSTKSRN